MGEIFANHVSDKGSISRIYRKLKLNNERQPDSKMSKGLKQTFLQRHTNRNVNQNYKTTTLYPLRGLLKQNQTNLTMYAATV